jgi:DNA-binding NarL/FixJ family response regulator
MTAAPRIVLADDREEILRAVVLILKDEFTVIGIAHNGAYAVELATELHPDILVLDISMPVENGIEAACHLKDVGSTAKVIFLTVNAESEFVEAALAAGARGYVLKQSLAEDLIPAIWAVVHGNRFISPSIQFCSP